MDQVETLDSYYIINGKKYVRNSYIAELMADNVGLNKWIEKVGVEEADRIAKEAAVYGDLVHEINSLDDWECTQACDSLVKTYPFLTPHWVNWHRWRVKYVVKTYAVEELVWSDRLGVAGRIDRVYLLVGDKKPSIVDIKTGNLSDDIGVKLAGYKIIWNEKHNGPKVQRCLAFHTPRKNPSHYRVVDYTKAEYTSKWKQGHKVWKEGKV